MANDGWIIMSYAVVVFGSVAITVVALIGYFHTHHTHHADEKRHSAATENKQSVDD